MRGAIFIGSIFIEDNFLGGNFSDTAKIIKKDLKAKTLLYNVIFYQTLILFTFLQISYVLGGPPNTS